MAEKNLEKMKRELDKKYEDYNRILEEHMKKISAKGSRSQI